MKILVIDVAAENGGALTILEQHIAEFEKDKENEYVVLLSKPKYCDRDNVRFLNFEWVKRSSLHRLFFDYVYIRTILRKEKFDKIISLQNNAVSSRGIEQEVYFHNALFVSEKRYSAFESLSLWTYQNVISHIVKSSLKRASKITVQSNWIKRALNEKWRISKYKIVVKRPTCDFENDGQNKKSCGANIFYPANYSLYKNHEVLINACISVWNKKETDCGLTLHLLGSESQLTKNCGSQIHNHGYPIVFHGRLTKEEMRHMYETTSLVYPSMIETVGLPLMEAAAIGSYIMAADLEYAHDTLGDYTNCTFFNPEDMCDLENLLLKLVE